MLAWGEERITSALTAVLNASTPLFTALAAVVLLNDRLRRSQLLGLVLGVVGVAVAAGVGGGDLADSSVAGSLASVGAGAWYGLAFVYMRRHLTGIPPVIAAAGQLTMATVLLLPFAVGTSIGPGVDLTAHRVLAIVLLGDSGHRCRLHPQLPDRRRAGPDPGVARHLHHPGRGRGTRRDRPRRAVPPAPPRRRRPDRRRHRPRARAALRPPASAHSGRRVRTDGHGRLGHRRRVLGRGRRLARHDTRDPPSPPGRHGRPRRRRGPAAPIPTRVVRAPRDRAGDRAARAPAPRGRRAGRSGQGPAARPPARLPRPPPVRRRPRDPAHRHAAAVPPGRRPQRVGLGRAALRRPVVRELGHRRPRRPAPAGPVVGTGWAPAAGGQPAPRPRPARPAGAEPVLPEQPALPQPALPAHRGGARLRCRRPGPRRRRRPRAGPSTPSGGSTGTASGR